jgi:uncharacterized protein YegL
MNNLLSERTAILSYAKIKNIHNDTNHSSREKTPKLWPILEDIFIELTSKNVAYGTTTIERMKTLFDSNTVPKEIVDNTHKTRMLCNAIRHKGHEANEIDYVGSVESIVKCIHYFSGVAIPPEVEFIFNSSITPPVVVQPIKQLQKEKITPQLTIRQKDLVDNPTARLPVTLLLDTSGSMLTDNRIGELNEGIRLFFNSILEDEVTKYSVELSIITFGRVVTKLLDFSNIERQFIDFQRIMPLTVKNVTDGTPMGEAVELAIKLLNERKTEYQISGIEYYQPWLVLMTDGQPTDNINNAATVTSSMINDEKLSLFPIAIGAGANLIELARFSPKREPLKLRGLNFREFFEWLKESAKSTSQSTPGQTINLTPPGWASI